MYKALLSLLLLFPIALFAQPPVDDCDEPLVTREWSKWTMEIRLAYFHPTSSRVQKIFSNGWIDYEVEVARRLPYNLQIWVGTDWTHKKGHLPKSPRGYHNSSKIAIVPIHAGIKAIFPVSRNLDFYLGGGACISFVKIKNHSDFYAGRLGSATWRKFIHKNNIGALAKTGLRYIYGKCTYFDLFADYYYTPDFNFGKKEFPYRKLNVSGYKIGLGLGVFF